MGFGKMNFKKNLCHLVASRHTCMLNRFGLKRSLNYHRKETVKGKLPYLIAPISVPHNGYYQRCLLSTFYREASESRTEEMDLLDRYE